jgi:HPr kinase/phosphorylase
MGQALTIKEFSAGTELECAYPGRGTVFVSSSDINRPGMQFMGYFEHFANERVQVFGHQEMGFIATLPEERLKAMAAQFFFFEIPALVICNGDPVPDWFMESAQKEQIPVFTSPLTTSTVVQYVVSFLNDVLAEEVTVHGNLVDVHNVGVLLRAESGMGKSELSLELIKRGHVLVADDVTVLRKTALKRLTGYAPEPTRGLLEIRGLGIMDVRQVYGSACVLDRKDLQIIIDMEMWNEQKSYDRLGFDEHFEKILGVEIPRYLMPVRPGRNLAVVVEATAMDYRMKHSGFNIEKEIFDRFRETFKDR